MRQRTLRFAQDDKLFSKLRCSVSEDPGFYDLTRGGRAVRLGAALLFVLLPMVCASARVLHNDAWARQQFAKAERNAGGSHGRPAGQRTRREYQRVIDSYRKRLLRFPASSKADPSVVATAELMVEMGRRFDDNKDSARRHRTIPLPAQGVSGSRYGSTPCSHRRDL